MSNHGQSQDSTSCKRCHTYGSFSDPGFVGLVLDDVETPSDETLPGRDMNVVRDAADKVQHMWVLHCRFLIRWCECFGKVISKLCTSQNQKHRNDVYI